MTSRCVLKYNNKINYIRIQSNTTMYFLPQWLLVSAITAFIRPMLYKNNFKRLVTCGALCGELRRILHGLLKIDRVLFRGEKKQ
jgi:hypothetical protein